MGKNIRWIIVLLLFLVYMINYLDRVVIIHYGPDD